MANTSKHCCHFWIEKGKIGSGQRRTMYEMIVCTEEMFGLLV